MLANVRAVGDGHALRFTVGRLGHPVHEHAVDVARQQIVPFTRPQHLDHVPARAAEDGLELLDDLAVPAHRTVETLQIAVHHEGQIVEALACRDVQRAERLGLVALAVADECPNARVRRLLDAAMLEVTVEARLVDRGERSEAHGHCRELPELGHQTRVRIAREPRTGHDLAPEMIELRLGEATLDERARVDAGRRVTLEEDLVARGVAVLAAEEVVEPDLVEACGRGVCREVAADALVVMVRAYDHGDGVPTDDPADPQLHRLVAREIRFLLGRDRVDVPRLGERREPHVEHPRPLEQLVEDEARAIRTGLLQQRVERLDPLLGLVRIDVRQLMFELVEDIVQVAHTEKSSRVHAATYTRRDAGTSASSSLSTSSSSETAVDRARARPTAASRSTTTTPSAIPRATTATRAGCAPSRRAVRDPRRLPRRRARSLRRERGVRGILRSRVGRAAPRGKRRAPLARGR